MLRRLVKNITIYSSDFIITFFPYCILLSEHCLAQCTYPKDDTSRKQNNAVINVFPYDTDFWEKGKKSCCNTKRDATPY